MPHACAAAVYIGSVGATVDASKCGLDGVVLFGRRADGAARKMGEACRRPGIKVRDA